MKEIWPQTARALTARADSSPCLDRGMNVVVIGCDLYNGTLTGDKAATVGANSGMSANHAGPAVIVGAFMAGQGSKARSIAWCDDGTTPTLKGHPSGLNMAPTCVYPINTMVALRGGKDDMRTCFGVGEPDDPQFTISAAHSHAVCYAIEGNVVDRNASQNGKGWCENVAPSLSTQDRHAICFEPGIARREGGVTAS